MFSVRQLRRSKRYWLVIATFVVKFQARFVHPARAEACG
jgi:hypothetical protein